MVGMTTNQVGLRSALSHARVGTSSSMTGASAQTKLAATRVSTVAAPDPAETMMKIGQRTEEVGKEGEKVKVAGGIATSMVVVPVLLPQPALAGGGGNGGATNHGGGGGGGGGGGPFGFPNEIFSIGAKVNMKPIDLILSSYAVTRAAYEKITKLFATQWTEKTGRKLYFRLSFGGSGTQTRAIIDGLPVDIFSPALEADLLKIEDEGYLNKGWETKIRNRGVVAETIIVLVTRPGNPKNVRDWKDLMRSDVTSVTPNPKTGGGARWNFLALWGSITSRGGKDEEALDFCDKVLTNTAALPRDSREAADMFFNGNVGDVLITYENEAILSNENRKKGQASYPYIVPDNTVRVEAPCIAVVDKNVDERGPEYRAVADEFVEFLFTPTAQRALLDTGFRSVLKEVQRESKLPRTKKLWTVGNVFGGWRGINKDFFDSGGYCDKILADLSVKKQKLKN